MDADAQARPGRLIVVSNRLPVVVETAEGRKALKPGAGGLVTALAPVMRREGGLWIGWPGTTDDEEAPGDELLARFAAEQSYDLATVALTRDEVAKYYAGFSNEAIWPLFHDLLSRCKFERDHWLTYVDVNRRFAEAVARRAAPGDFVWIHDYQLMLAAREMRDLGYAGPLAFFLHIPFPSPDLLRRLPWRDELVRALLEFDLVGFQTLRDRRNFVAGVRAVCGQVEVRIRRRQSEIRVGARWVKVGNFPIGIDYDEFHDLAKTPEVAAEAEAFHGEFHAKTLALGVDRLDYTKGVPERFLAFARALEKYPELRGNLSLIQFLIPSRTDVPEYMELKSRVDELVGRINGEFSAVAWTPIHYRFRSLTRAQLVGRYRACEIALVTPERDGMNLVSKEYVASQVDRTGVLILSEFAGAADQLGKGAIVVNPFDREATADAIHRAYNMPREERARRMAALQAEVKRNDVYHWVNYFLESFRDERGRG